ncbi:MAG: cupredoxin domain-containing protein [Nitrosopumilus sp.]
MKVTTKKTTMTVFFSMLTVTVTSLILIAVPGAYAETTVSLPVGSAIPGCQDTNECYIPAQVTVGVGETVTWSNDDTAAHTVTSGTAEGGPDGLFDSSLFAAGTTFSHTFEQEGTFDYFCMVHPWMVGSVIVGTGGTAGITTSASTEETIETEPSVEEKEEEVDVVVKNDMNDTMEDKVEKEMMMPNPGMKAMQEEKLFISGELTSPIGDAPTDDPFGGDEAVGDYYIRIRDGEQVRIIANLNPAPGGTVLEGWLVDFESGYALSTGKANDQNKMIFTQRMVNPSIYDAVVITAEPINDVDPNPAALHIGGAPIGELFN